ncbi:TolC family protein [Nevskia sp.]|uniref:TolC family protein n=1 Tax=Nevskia sp. TaxID=1929292 RepID=UPI003F71066D
MTRRRQAAWPAMASAPASAAPRWRRWAARHIAVLLLAAALPAVAADAGPPAAMTLRQALHAALTGNPELRNFAWDFKAQDALAAQAARRPNPQLNAQAEDFAGTGASRGFTGSEFSLSISQALELGDKRRRRVELASEQRRLIEADRAIRQLDVVAEVARCFIRVAADQERSALAERAVALATATRDEVQKRVDAARSPLAEASRAGIQLARARLDQQQVARQLAGDRQRLAALWGDAAPAFGEVAAALYRLPAVDDYARLREKLARNPDLSRFVSAARLREAELRLAIAQGVPNLTVEAGLRRNQDSDSQGLLFALQLPLTVNDRNRGNIDAARTERERLDADQAALALRLSTELFALHQQLAQARAEVEGLEREILPRAHEALDQARYAWQRGRYGYLEWVDVQRELLVVERQHIDAAEQYHLQLAEIERLTGEALAEALPEPLPPSAATGTPPP